MSTIGDVAKRAGVSPATVSRFLTGHSVRAHEAIAQAIDELSYSPNAIARSLKSGVTGNIGVVVPDITNPFFAQAVKGIEEGSREQSYNIFLANTNENAERQNEILTAMIGMIDALILTPAIESAEVPEALERHSVPVVLLDREFGEDLGLDSVLVDNLGGARQAARHLTQLGHRDIAIISGPLDSTPGRLRHQGFLEGLRDAGVEPPADFLHMGDFREMSGYLGIKALLSLERRPSAVFVANNSMAVGALRGCREAGARLPQDFSFVSFDDFELGDLFQSAITTVSRPTVEQGALAMSLLSERLAGQAPERPRKCVLETRLSVRDSSGPPPSLTTP